MGAAGVAGVARHFGCFWVQVGDGGELHRAARGGQQEKCEGDALQGEGAAEERQVTYSRTVVQSYSRTVVQSYSRTVVQSYSRTVVQSYSRTVVQSYSRTVVQSYSRTVVRPPYFSVQHRLTASIEELSNNFCFIF